MARNEQGNPSLFCIMTHHHDQFHFFHRRREEKAKLSPPWDTTNFEPKLLTKSTHSFLPGNLSGVTSSSKTLNQDFSHLDRASASGAAKLRFFTRKNEVLQSWTTTSIHQSTNKTQNPCWGMKQKGSICRLSSLRSTSIFSHNFHSLTFQKQPSWKFVVQNFFCDRKLVDSTINFQLSSVNLQSIYSRWRIVSLLAWATT